LQANPRGVYGPMTMLGAFVRNFTAIFVIGIIGFAVVHLPGFPLLNGAIYTALVAGLVTWAEPPPKPKQPRKKPKKASAPQA